MRSGIEVLGVGASEMREVEVDRRPAVCIPLCVSGCVYPRRVYLAVDSRRDCGLEDEDGSQDDDHALDGVGDGVGDGRNLGEGKERHLTIKGNQGQSRAIKGTRWQLRVIKGNLGGSITIRGNQGKPIAVDDQSIA